MEMEKRRLNLALVGLLLEIYCRLGPVTAELKDEAAINDTKAMDILTRVMKSANKLVRPNVYGPPVMVHCDFYVQSMGPINEVDMDFRLEIYFRLRWKDERLSFPDREPPLMVPHQEIEKLWVPDVYFPNEKEAKYHVVTTPNTHVIIYPNGSITQSTRITLRLACNMLLMSFPLDYQKCEITISSYAFDTSQLRLEWYTDTPVTLDPSDLSLPQFELLNTTISGCVLPYKAANFSCLRAIFHLKRQIGFYVLQTYIPSILIVMLSWVSFWISKDAVPARISLGVTTVLTMTTQLSTSRSNSMRVSYPKAIDVWYASCMMFVFGALLEYALINVLSRSRDGRHGRNGKRNRNAYPEKITSETHLNPNDIEMQCQQKSAYDTIHDPNGETGDKNRSPRELYRRFVRHCRTITAKGVDHASRTIFPGAFAVFNFIYWVVYTQPGLFVLDPT